MEVLLFILSVLVSIGIGFLFLYFSPSWEASRDRFNRWKNTKLYQRKQRVSLKIGPITLAGVEEARLKPIRIGDLVFPITVYVGGDGKTKYSHPEGIISKWNPAPLEMPADLHEACRRFRELREKEAIDRGAVFVQREHVRIDDYSFDLEGLEDIPWPLKLLVSRTTYYELQGTNASIDEVLPDGATVREKYANDPQDLLNSVLANPLATNMSVVTADRQIYVAVRGKKTASNPGGFAPAVSGTGNPLTDCDDTGRYVPFLTAQREAEEEILSFKADLSELTFFGLARTLKFQYPFLFGEIRLKAVTSSELESYFPRDNWETERFVSIPFEIENVIEFIKRIYLELDEKNIINTGTYAALFSILQSLLYEYPDSWQNVVKSLINIEKKAPKLIES